MCLHRIGAFHRGCCIQFAQAHCTLHIAIGTIHSTYDACTLRTHAFQPKLLMFIYRMVAHVPQKTVQKQVHADVNYVHISWIEIASASIRHTPSDRTAYTRTYSRTLLPNAQLICGRLEVSSKIVCYRRRRFQMSRFTTKWFSHRQCHPSERASNECICSSPCVMYCRFSEL